MRPNPSPEGTRRAWLVGTALCACTGAMCVLLGGCSSTSKHQDAEPPTLKSLAGRPVVVQPDHPIAVDEQKTIAAYKDFLKASPQAAQRAEAMRRLGDLEMDHAENRIAGGTPSVAAAGPAGAPTSGQTTGTSAGALAGTAGTTSIADQPDVTAGGARAKAGAAGGKAGAAAAAASSALPAQSPAAAAVEPAVDYRGAIAQYLDFLKTYPNDPGNDRVLYQLARAYEQSGALDSALQTLTRLVQQYPNTRYLDEAQFRRGELLFTTRDYVRAEQAYQTVLHGDSHSPYYERSLYMHGWSLFKQGRLEDALQSFFGVLDLRLAAEGGSGSAGASTADAMAGMARADRELLEDTFRVTSLSLENLQGAESIPPYMTTPPRHAYEAQVYEQLADLYLNQERFKDAADTLGAFTRRYPLDAQAPQLQAKVIEIYQRAGFSALVLEAKKEFVAHYGARSEFRHANPVAWERAQPLVKDDLQQLARHYHAAAQKSHQRDDYQEAVRWYREFLASFPSDAQAAQSNFLLAELLYESASFDPDPSARYAAAAVEYEKTAYEYPHHPRSADAGYSALLAYAEQEKRLAAPAPASPQTAERAAALRTLQAAGVDSALRFAQAFPLDPRAPPVLTNAADTLYALHQPDRASQVAQQVLALNPPAGAAQRRVAWTVVAQVAFEQGAFDRAERGYGEVLALTPDGDPRRADLTERLAASIYKQGEQARAAGQARVAVAAFNRVAVAAPLSPVRANAEYDAAALLIGLKDWDAAQRALEDFRQRYPNNPLQDQVSAKLALVYLEKGQSALAAAEFERVAASSTNPQAARDALWQAAELYDKAGTPAQAAAAGAYERYLRQYPQPLEPAVEARYRLARIAAASGDRPRELAWMKEVLQADQSGGATRTDRTRYLGATAALALAEPVYDEFHRVALVEPLQRQLKLKKAKMEDVLRAYGAAADYRVADVATAVTYKTAQLYQEFGKALLESQRPGGLSSSELEQYNLMLEDQADPFQDKAIALHELNAHRGADGLYDQWVKASYAALGQLRPLRYAKSERSEVAIDAIR